MPDHANVGWLTWALLSALAAAVTAIFTRAAVLSVPPEPAVLIRASAAAIALLLVFATVGKLNEVRQVTVSAWLLLAVAGVGTAASWYCYTRAMALAPAGRVAAVDKLSVALTAVAGVFVLREQLTMREWAGVALVTLGAVLMAWRE